MNTICNLVEVIVLLWCRGATWHDCYILPDLTTWLQGQQSTFMTTCCNRLEAFNHKRSVKRCFSVLVLYYSWKIIERNWVFQLSIYYANNMHLLAVVLLLVPEIQPWTCTLATHYVTNPAQFPHFPTLRTIDSKRESANSTPILNKCDVRLLLALNTLVCLCRLQWRLEDSLLDKRKESLAHLHGSWRSHLFPLQNVPAGQSYRRCGTRDGFIFHRRTAVELFLCSHMETGGARWVGVRKGGR